MLVGQGTACSLNLSMKEAENVRPVWCFRDGLINVGVTCVCVFVCLQINAIALDWLGCSMNCLQAI